MTNFLSELTMMSLIGYIEQFFCRLGNTVMTYFDLALFFYTMIFVLLLGKHNFQTRQSLSHFQQKTA